MKDAYDEGGYEARSSDGKYLARSQGVIIHCIGLSGNGGLDEQALRDWASDPYSAYVAITPDDAEGNAVTFPSPTIEVDYGFECCCDADTGV